MLASAASTVAAYSGVIPLSRPVAARFWYFATSSGFGSNGSCTE